jgi:hypothetical protein
MLLALIDYLQYRFQKGPYSQEILRSQGTILAREELFNHYKDLGNDHLCFVHSRVCWRSWLIMYYTDGIFSHVANLAGGGQLFHATTSGVKKESIRILLNARNYIKVGRLHQVSPEQQSKLSEFLESQVDCPFNWLGVFRMYGSILLGSHASFRWRFALDLEIVLLSLLLLFQNNAAAVFCFGSLGGIYIIVLIITSSVRKREREEFVASSGADFSGFKTF